MEGRVKRKMPIGIQDFEKLIQDGYIYVDKTERIYQMVTQGGYYFLSRPRRFGKSLLISTLEALFLGKREVFKGLVASTNGMSEEECSGTMRIRYGAFHFENNSIEVYNPFSVLNAFGQMMFDSYWFKAEDPSYLIPFLNSGKYVFEELLSVSADSDVLNSVHFDSLYPIPILFQSGYLTIKGYDPRFKTYTLGFPNEEVEEGFVNFSKETRNIEEVLVG